jgi:hypothetical protein
MKLILQLLLTSLTFFAGVSIVSGLDPGSVVINEVELNPSGEATEWVELYNSGEDSVDIGFWRVEIVEILPPSCRWTGAEKIPKGTTLSANEFYVVEGDPRWAHGNNGTVSLITYGGVEVDKTHLLSDDGDNDFTWCRYPNGLDTDTRSDWVFIKSTPGAENSLRLVSA